MKTPKVMPMHRFSSRPSINAGLYMPLCQTARQNGAARQNATMVLLRLSCALASKLMLSFALIRHAINEGNTSTRVLSASIMTTNDMSTRMLKSISVASFCFVSHVFENGYNPVSEVALDGDFSVLRAAAHSAFHLQRASKLSEVVA